MKFLAYSNIALRALSIMALAGGVIGMNNAGHDAVAGALAPLALGVFAFGVLTILSMIVSTAIDIWCIRR